MLTCYAAVCDFPFCYKNGALEITASENIQYNIFLPMQSIIPSLNDISADSM